MFITQECWRPIVNDFNPIGVVRPEEVERFFVDREEQAPVRSRLRQMQMRLRNSLGQSQPYTALLTGHVGSGKSTELMRLGQELADDYFVVWFDAETSLATETANHFDVLIGMGVAIHAAAREAGLKPDDSLIKVLLDSLSTFVQKHTNRSDFALKLSDVIKQVFTIALVAKASAIGGPIAAIAAGAAVVGANQFLKATHLELNVSDELVQTLELPANRIAIMGALNNVIDDVSQKAKKPLLVIIDGLDKVSAVRASMLFAKSALLAEPACALVYAAPIEFYHRLMAKQATQIFQDYWMLSNPAVHQPPLVGVENWLMERKGSDTGMAVMIKVVTMRIETRELTLEQVIDLDVLKRLAMASGGVMRELVRYIREAAINAQLLSKSKIDGEIAQQVLSRHRTELSPSLTVSHREALRDVLVHGALLGGGREAIEDQLLRGLYLLSYESEDGAWFDAHPNVLALLRDAPAVSSQPEPLQSADKD